MLKRNYSPANSEKLFNLIVSNYLNNSINEPFQVPNELLQSASEFNLPVFKGTNYISYNPETFFKAQDLQKLNELKAKVTELRDEIDTKKDELTLPTDQSISTAYKGYMETLHRYNEAKDTAQALIGKLAQLTGTTTKELYPKFNLSVEDWIKTKHDFISNQENKSGYLLKVTFLVAFAWKIYLSIFV